MSCIAIRRAILSAALVLPNAIIAQKPTAESVFDKHAAAVGGVSAFRALTAVTETGTADITFAGIQAGYERKMSGGKMLQTIDVAGFGQVVQGFDGTIAWSVNPQSGASKASAAESADAAAATSFTASIFQPGSYASAEVLDATEFEGAKVWPVKVTSASGRVRTVYFDQVTGLKVGEQVSQGGADVKIVYSDYKPFGAIKLPTKVTQGTPNGDVVVMITAVKFDPIEASAFALPEAVKALP
jgi:hypothetical protein